MEINILEPIALGGANQWISIRAQTSGTPLLLYLHDGPGEPALPLLCKYNQALENHFTVAVLEQRGAGKSYTKLSPDAPLTLDLLLEDLHQVIQHLLARFQQEKLYLMGHGWGSVLGLRLVQMHPELVTVYLGCAQIVNMKKSARFAHEYLLGEAIRTQNQPKIDRLLGIDPTFPGTRGLHDFFFVQHEVIRSGGSLYGRSNYSRFFLDFINSDLYTIKDLFHLRSGRLQSYSHLWQTRMAVDFEGVTAFAVPVIFLAGRHDYHLSSALTEGYFQTIRTPKQFFWFEESCHFPQWSQPDLFNQTVITLLKETFPPATATDSRAIPTDKTPSFADSLKEASHTE